MLKRDTVLLLLLLLTAFFLGGCARFREVSPLNVTPTTQVVPKPSVSPPEQGRATVVGRLISSKTGEPLVKTVVRLAEVYYADQSRSPESGIYVLDNAFSPSAITDQNGFFVFPNVEARDYVIIVGDIYVNYTVISNPDGTPKVWTVSPDQVTDLGEISADF